MTRALVVGAGSIGLRHAEVLSRAGYEVALVSSRTDLDWPVFREITSALEEFAPSYVVIATQTSLHGPSVDRLAQSGFTGTVLIEKPLAVSPETAKRLPFERVGVGFNLRFHPVIERLREVLADTTIHTVEAYAGQHLDTWRPSRSTRAQYSAVKSQGGGVLRDLSHELDYLRMLLGDCLGVFARGGRLGAVTEDSDDAWGVVADFDRAPVVTLQLNYLDTNTRRRLVINTSSGTIEADLVAGTLRVNDSVETFEVDRNSTYRALHTAMMQPDSAVATIEEALAVDATIEMIEKSAKEQKWITAE